MSENNIVNYKKMNKDLRKSQCVIAKIPSIKDQIIVSHLLYVFQSKNLFGLSRKLKMCVCLHVCHMCRIVCFLGGGKSSWFRVRARKCWSVSDFHYFRNKANSHFLKHALSYTSYDKIFWCGEDWQLSNFFQKHFDLQACHLSLIL